MGTICLSTSAILRCQSSTNLQNIGLVIPTAIEVIFSTSLVFKSRSSGLRHLWLTAEGWLYFTLVLLEMISHIEPAVRKNPDLFELFDRILAASSSVPILFYTLFIFFMMRAELVNILPSPIQTPFLLFLLLFIPVIITVTEVSSFLGVSYELVTNPPPPLVIAGFKNDGNRMLWEFFTFLGLSIFTGYQILSAAIPLYRAVSALVNEQSINAAGSEEIHILKGIVWILFALAVGAVETAVGFVNLGFCGVLARRILRLLARALLVIGVTKGVDSVEDFELIRREIMGSKKSREPRRSRIFISNPRFSTFRHLTATNTSAFTTVPRAAHSISNYRQSTFLERDANRDAVVENDFDPTRRVTVHYVNGTPRLNLRLSDIFSVDDCDHDQQENMNMSALPPWPFASGFPYTPQRRSLLSSLALTEGGQEVDLRSFSPTSKILSSRNVEDPPSPLDFPMITNSLPVARSRIRFPPARFGKFSQSNTMLSPTSAVHFSDPSYNIPHRAGPRTRMASGQSFHIQIPFSRDDVRSADVSTSVAEAFFNSPTETQVSTLRSSWMGDINERTRRSLNDEKNDRILEAAGLLRKSSLRRSAMLESISEAPASQSGTSKGIEDGGSSWINIGSPGKLRRKRSKGAYQHTNNMSIGTAPMRSTPAPTTINDARDSLRIDSIFFTRRESSIPDVLPESYKSFNSHGVLRDSEVLGMEDRYIWRGQRY